MAKLNYDLEIPVTASQNEKTKKKINYFVFVSTVAAREQLHQLAAAHHQLQLHWRSQRCHSQEKTTNNNIMLCNGISSRIPNAWKLFFFYLCLLFSSFLLLSVQLYAVRTWSPSVNEIRRSLYKSLRSIMCSLRIIVIIIIRVLCTQPLTNKWTNRLEAAETTVKYRKCERTGNTWNLCKAQTNIKLENCGRRKTFSLFFSMTSGSGECEERKP